MLRNYINTALRGISKSKFYAILNVLGLAVGFAAFIFIYMYVSNELAYDKYHEKAARIYRIESDFNISGKHDQFAIVPVPMAPAMRLEFPEIENFCRFDNLGNTLFRYNEKEFYEEDFYFADSTLFDIFSFNLIRGNPKTCLVEPFSMVISQTIAKKYFGESNPMGEILESGSGRKYKISGVMEDVPANSHLWFNAALSTSSLVNIVGEERYNSMEPGAFWNIGVFAYVLLKPNTSIESIHAKFGSLYDKYMKPVGDSFNATFDLMSTPLTQTHFAGNISSDLPTGNMTYIYIFGAIALFILLIAAINYMNMATARSVKRAREVGIRKVAGAVRSQLIGQFLTESLLLALVGVLIAVGIVALLLPDFNTLSGKSLDLSIFIDPTFLITLIGTTLLIGLISGSYPAFYLSSFKPVTIIKGSSLGKGKSGGVLRRVLVVFQFAIAIAMIIATLVVSSQLSFLKNKDMGFQKENMVILELQDTTFRSKAETFKKELLQNSNIQAVSNSTGIPGNNGWIQVVRMEKDTAMIDETMIITVVDYDYIDTYRLDLIAGRNFDIAMGTDAAEAVIVNQATIDRYGWGDNPIGKKIHWGFDLDGTGGRVLKVVGVVRDFHFNSLHNKVEPIMMFLADFNKRFLTLRINPENYASTLQYIEDTWNKNGAKRPFDYQLLEDTWGEKYEAEQKLGLIFTIATLLTIFIALLGLLGLSSFVSEQRTREIGIRKVLGASVASILTLLNREFVLLILIAFIIAIPIALWQLSNWLESNFVYHITISIGMVSLAGAIALLISLLTISFHSLKAATNNPVEAIKYE